MPYSVACLTQLGCRFQLNDFVIVPMRFLLIAIVGSSPIGSPQGSFPGEYGCLCQCHNVPAVDVTDASMRIAHDFIASGPLVSSKLRMLAELFDEVWASVAAVFGKHPNQIENARIRLAKIVLDLAKDNQIGPLQITRTAGRLMRQTPRGRINPHDPLRLSHSVFEWWISGAERHAAWSAYELAPNKSVLRGRARTSSEKENGLKQNTPVIDASAAALYRL